jgi:hypothetical protein
VSPDGRHVYIALRDSGKEPEPDTHSILIIDTSSNAATATRPIAGEVFGIGISGTVGAPTLPIATGCR